MSNNTETSEKMYGISRVDDDIYNTHAWRVSLCRYGKRLVKNFPDRKFFGKREALQKAINFRDQLMSEHPPISRKEFCNVKRRNNKTGITGVYKYRKTYQLKDGTIKETWYWEANWPDAEGESISKSFSTKTFGEELAKQMAIRAREEGMSKVKGTYWAAKRGEVDSVHNSGSRASANRIDNQIDAVA